MLSSVVHVAVFLWECSHQPEVRMSTKALSAAAVILSLLWQTPVPADSYDVCVDPGHCDVHAGCQGYLGGEPNEYVRTMEIAREFSSYLATDPEPGTDYYPYMTRFDD